jgi:two-component system, NtrC family, sensor kinase
MSIRRRLTLSYIAILALLAVNLVVYFWGDRRRQSTVEELRRAISRQILISSVQQKLSEYEKQVTLLSQMTGDTNSGGASPEDIAAFNSRLDGIGDQLRKMSSLSDAGGRGMIDNFSASFRDLSASWSIFYENFGRNQARAITEEVTHSEPLGQKVLKELLPELQQHQAESVEAASARFYDAARTTDRITVLIFFVSVGLAATLALMVSRRLTRGLAVLKTGADALGEGNLAYRIPTVSKDELGDLARTFNDMGGRLHSARGELEQRQHELQVLMDRERLKSEELEQALLQLKTTQDQLLVQEKMASLGVLTAGIAHEIKNPLNFVTNFAALSVELIEEARELFEQFGQKLETADAEYMGQLMSDLNTNLKKISEHGNRADSIVKGMLAHSRGGAGQFQLTNLNVLIEEAAGLAYHGLRAQDVNFNIALESSYDPALPMVSVVPQDLSRAILNIVNNGCYAAHQRALKSPGFQPVLRCSTAKVQNGVEIRIRDNGTGVPKEVLPKIFNPFFTTKPTGSGTGLGLSLSYQIVVDQHKGTMRVETQEGEFTEFILTLPERT